MVAGVGLIQKGEKIIGPAEIVTPQLYQVLQTYELMLDKQSSFDRSQRINSYAGKTIFVMLLLGMLYTYMYFYLPGGVRRVKFVLLPLLLPNGGVRRVELLDEDEE